MVVDRATGEKEPFGDLGVAEAVGDEPEDVELPAVRRRRSRRSSVAGRAGRRVRRLPQPSRDHARDRAGARDAEAPRGPRAALPRRRPRTAPGPPRTGGRGPPRGGRRAPVACELERPRLRDLGGTSSTIPFFRRQYASSPSHHDEAATRSRSYVACVASRASSVRRSSHAISARAQARGACQPGSLAAATIASASARRGAVSGSPRRARTSASTSNACSRGSGESRDLGDDQFRGRRRIRPCAASSSSRTRRESRASRQRSSSRPSQCASPASIHRAACSCDRARPTRARGWTSHERPAGAAVLAGLVEGPLERLQVSGAEQLDRREGDRAVDALLGVAEPARELHRSIPPREHGLVVATVRREKGHRAGRIGEQRALRQALERLDRTGGGLLGLGQEASARQIGHEPAPCGGLPIDSARSPVLLDRPLELGDRGDLVVGEVAGRPTDARAASPAPRAGGRRRSGARARTVRRPPDALPAAWPPRRPPARTGARPRCRRRPPRDRRSGRDPPCRGRSR